MRGAARRIAIVGSGPRGLGGGLDGFSASVGAAANDPDAFLPRLTVTVHARRIDGAERGDGGRRLRTC